MLSQEKVSKLQEEFYAANTPEAQKVVMDANHEFLSALNRRDRKLGRVGMPLSARLDDRTDEVPFIAGTKRVVTYVGGTVGCVIGALKLYRWIF